MTSHRRAILKVLWGKAASQKIAILPGQSVTVGRGEDANLSLSHDRNLSLVHFVVDFTGTMIRVQDAGSHGGTIVDGRPFVSGVVESGAVIMAGETIFRVFLERNTPPAETEHDPARTAAAELALAALRAEAPLYGVFDAARDPRILVLLDESVDPAWSLYEGAEGDAMAEVAPYVVRFQSDSDLLEAMVREGWGHAWGIYFTASRPMKEVRRHLRRFLMVQPEDSRERIYFRFYDPRVLREFLPIATPRQKSELFGDLAWFLYEDEHATLVRTDPLVAHAEERDFADEETTTEGLHVPHP